MNQNKIEAKNQVINKILINYYFSVPEKAEKSLVFLHGWGTDSRLWLESSRPLMDEKTALYFLDLPGFGKSELPATNIGLTEYAEIVEGFIKKNKLKKTVLIGHSFGGKVASRLAMANPDYLDRLVLVNSAGIVHNSVSKKLKKFIAKISKPFFKPSFMHAARLKIYRMIGSEYHDRPQLAGIFSRIVSEDIVKKLGRIKIPTLIIWGGQDQTTPVDDAYVFNQKIPGSKLVIFNGADHFSFLDEPARFCREILKFI